MLIQNGHQQLQDFTNKNYEHTITEVTKGVWFVLGLGHSNAIFIEAGSSVILIDTLDTRERGEQLLDLIRQNTKKEVGTIIYTHGHPDPVSYTHLDVYKRQLQGIGPHIHTSAVLVNIPALSISPAPGVYGYHHTLAAELIRRVTDKTGIVNG